MLLTTSNSLASYQSHTQMMRLSLWSIQPSRFVRPFKYSTLSSVSKRMYSQWPPWLETLLHDTTPPSKLYAWSPSNVPHLSNVDSDHLNAPSLRLANVQDDLDKRIYILGVGNLGRLFASCLADLPNRPPITLVVHREELLTQWFEGDGIEMSRSGVVNKNKCFDIEYWTDTPPQTGPVHEVARGRKLRNLLITTKATAALPQVDRARRYLDRSGTVAFAQNGMSKLWPPHGPSYVSHRFDKGNAPDFLACVTTHGVTSLGVFKSLHASQADVVLGTVLPNHVVNGSTRYLENQLTRAPHLNSRSVSRGELWILQLEKLVVNAVINPLTAILRCQNGELFTEPDGVIAKIIDQLLSEVSTVLQLLLGHDSSRDIIKPQASSQRSEDDTSLDLSAETLLYRFSSPRLKEMLYRVGYKVKDNTSSMLQDVRTGRSTEIRDFNGWIVETAAFLDKDLDVTGHQTMVDLVEAGATLDKDQLGSYFNSSSKEG